MSEITVTDQQMNSEHAYEDQFSRRMAWTFENVFAGFVRRYEPGTEDRGGAFRGFGQLQLDEGRDKLAKAWADFLFRKFETKAGELDQSVSRGQCGPAEAVTDLLAYSGGFLQEHQAAAILLVVAGR